MGSIGKDRLYKVGEKTSYTSIYGYPKNRYEIIDAETGKSVGEVKEERTPGVPGQPDICVYYTRGIEKPHGTLRFYQSPESLVIALGGNIDTSHIAAVEPEIEKTIVKAADVESGVGIEARLKALEAKMATVETEIASPKPRRTPKKAAKKSSPKSAKKPTTGSRKIKATL